jgi:hypothetical protein
MPESNKNALVTLLGLWLLSFRSGDVAPSWILYRSTENAWDLDERLLHEIFTVMAVRIMTMLMTIILVNISHNNLILIILR